MLPWKSPTWGLWWAAFLIGLVGVSTFAEVLRTTETHLWVTHSNLVLYHLEALISALKDAETGQRGYIITKRDDFLRPYYEAQVSVPRELETLRRLTADNPDQQRRVDQLRPLVLSRLGILKQNLRLSRTVGLSAAQEAIRQGTGKRLMDRIRRDIATMETSERSLLAKRSAAARTTSLIAGLTALVGAALLFGIVVRTTGVIQRDIGRRMILEQALRESEQRLSITLYSIGDAVMAVDGLGRVTLMNEGAQRVSGWTEKEALGRNHSEIFRLVNEDSRDPVESPIEHVLQGCITVSLATQTMLMRRDGSEVPIEDSAAPLFDSDGGLLGAVLVFRDITPRKDLERAVQREANLARSMQMAALPAMVPTIPGLEIAARCEFAKDVGGDFYLFLPSQDRIDLILGDVSGKGTPAALAATSIAHLLPWLHPMDDPLATLRNLNQDLLDRLPDNAFATVVLAEVDASASTLRVWNAGHPPAILWRDAKRQVRTGRVRNPLLGVFPDWIGEPEHWVFSEGDALVLYTDGLSETRDLTGAMFEREISKILSRMAGSSAGDIADALLSEAEAWGPRVDDVTVLVCKRVGDML